MTSALRHAAPLVAAVLALGGVVVVAVAQPDRPSCSNNAGKHRVAHARVLAGPSSLPTFESPSTTQPTDAARSADTETTLETNESAAMPPDPTGGTVGATPSSPDTSAATDVSTTSSADPSDGTTSTTPATSSPSTSNVTTTLPCPKPTDT